MTYSDEDVDAAVAAGVLPADAAAALRAHAEATRRLPPADEEHFRLVTGFNDVFVVIAGALLLSAVSWIGASWRPWAGALLAAATAWALAEFFVRRRRMALPAITLLLAFVAAVAGCAALALDAPAEWRALAGAVAGVLAAVLHWVRFRVPITMAAGAAAAVVAVLVAWGSVAEHADVAAPMFLCGLLVFAWAVRWDASDRERRTRRSDVAFWLHLLAAPLLVHPVFRALGRWDGGFDIGRALVVLALYLVIALVSLWIDRRALMVSALGYVLYTFSGLLQQQGFVSLGFAVTALVVGGALLLLSAFWQRSRATTLRWLPARWQQRVPAMR